MNIKRLIEDAGGPSEVARCCDVHRPTIYRWVRQGWIRSTHLETILNNNRALRLKDYIEE